MNSFVMSLPESVILLQLLKANKTRVERTIKYFFILKQTAVIYHRGIGFWVLIKNLTQIYVFPHHPIKHRNAFFIVFMLPFLEKHYLCLKFYSYEIQTLQP